MTGLLLKDLFLFKKFWFKPKFVMVFLLLLALSIVFLKENSVIISIFIAMFFLNSVQSLFSSDIKSGWLKYLNTTGLTSRKIVFPRFLSSLSICLFANLISLIVNVLLFVSFRISGLEEYFMITLLTFCISTVYIVFILPCIYLLDQNGLTIAVILLMITGFLLSRIQSFLTVVSDFIASSSYTQIGFYTLLAIVLLGFISFSISTVIYKYRFMKNGG